MLPEFGLLYVHTFTELQLGMTGRVLPRIYGMPGCSGGGGAFKCGNMHSRSQKTRERGHVEDVKKIMFLRDIYRGVKMTSSAKGHIVRSHRANQVPK